MSSIVGPAAWDLGYADENTEQRGELVSTDAEGRKWATLRLYNTNTRKIIASTFRVGGEPLRYCAEGGYKMDGVPGTQSQITMEFLDPAGAKTGKALPTRNAVDVLELPSGEKVQASLVDVGNPGVFVAASSVGLTMPCTPFDVEADCQLKTKLERIRRAGASAMGLDPDTESVPKIVLLFPPAEKEQGVDIRCLAMSMGQAHKAVPLTLALCLGAASKITGTLAESMIAAEERRDTVTIAHPSGKLDVGTRMEKGKIVTAKLLRTARVMMKGDVFY
jgi:2-methylaconitate cis-trans-isomerase PrpF